MLNEDTILFLKVYLLTIILMFCLLFDRLQFSMYDKFYPYHKLSWFDSLRSLLKNFNLSTLINQSSYLK